MNYREVKKKGIRLRLFMQNTFRFDVYDRSRIENIYHASVQKTGSQWIREIFSDPEIVRRTGLRIHPQLRYEMGQFKKTFPRFTFIPGLYIPYPLYKEIKKPDRYKTIYVIRDPRDIVVSWYYSMKYTHELMGTVSEHRRNLRQLNEAEGVTYCIEHLQWKFSFVRTWWYNQTDPDVHLVKFEELISNPLAEWVKIFEHCEIEINIGTLQEVLSRYTKDKMRKRDLKRQAGRLSHYRKGKKGWKDLFTETHVERFKCINGDLVKELGYNEW